MNLLIFKYCIITICTSDLSWILFFLPMSQPFSQYFLAYTGVTVKIAKQNWSDYWQQYETELPSTGGVHLLCCTLSFSILSAEVLGIYTCYWGLYLCCLQTYNFLSRSLSMLVLSSPLVCCPLVFSSGWKFAHSWIFARDTWYRNSSNKYAYFRV